MEKPAGRPVFLWALAHKSPGILGDKKLIEVKGLRG